MSSSTSDQQQIINDEARNIPSFPCKKRTSCEQSGSGRERLKRHREEVAGHVAIPDKWSQEEMLKDWMDFTSFNALLAPNGISLARQALMSQASGGQSATRPLRIEGQALMSQARRGQSANSPLRIEGRC